MCSRLNATTYELKTLFVQVVAKSRMPRKAASNAPRFVTLADLHREGAKLWMACRGCNKINSLTPHTLIGGRGGFARPDVVPEEIERTTIAEVAAKLKCSRCGGRDVEKDGGVPRLLG